MPRASKKKSSVGAEPSSVSTLGYALLGLVQMSPANGYQLRRVFVDTPMARYSSPGAVYPALRKLKAQGLIVADVTLGKTGRPAEHYQISRPGRATLRAWLRRLPEEAEIRGSLDAMLLRFSYLDLLDDPAFSIQFLTVFRDVVRAMSQQLEGIQAAMRDRSLHGRLALDCGQANLQTYVDWATRAIAELRTRQSRESSRGDA